MSYDSPVTFIQRLRKEGHPIRVQPYQLPEGEYEASWSGYNARVVIGEDEYQMATNLGIRGEDVYCVVKVANGKVSVSSREDPHIENPTMSSETFEPPSNRPKGGWIKRDPNAVDETP